MIYTLTDRWYPDAITNDVVCHGIAITKDIYLPLLGVVSGAEHCFILSDYLLPTAAFVQF
jgi:hypothetical protein